MEVVGFESLPTGARQDEGSSQGGCCSAFALWDNTPYSVCTEFRATRAEEGQGRCRLALKNFLILAPPPLLVQATLGLSLQDNKRAGASCNNRGFVTIQPSGRRRQGGNIAHASKNCVHRRNLIVQDMASGLMRGSKTPSRTGAYNCGETWGHKRQMSSQKTSQ